MQNITDIADCIVLFFFIKDTINITKKLNVTMSFFIMHDFPFGVISTTTASQRGAKLEYSKEMCFACQTFFRFVVGLGIFHRSNVDVVRFAVERIEICVRQCEFRRNHSCLLIIFLSINIHANIHRA